MIKDRIMKWQILKVLAFWIMGAKKIVLGPTSRLWMHFFYVGSIEAWAPKIHIVLCVGSVRARAPKVSKIWVLTPSCYRSYNAIQQGVLQNKLQYLRMCSLLDLIQFISLRPCLVSLYVSMKILVLVEQEDGIAPRIHGN